MELASERLFLQIPFWGVAYIFYLTRLWVAKVNPSHPLFYIDERSEERRVSKIGCFSKWWAKKN